MKQLKALEALAVAKALTSTELKAVREGINPGEYKIDVTCRICGTIKVGEPFEQVLSAAVPWEILAKVLFDKLNPATQRAALDEILTAWNDGELDALRDDVDDRVSDETWGVFQGLKDRTSRVVNGKVNARLVAERV